MVRNGFSSHWHMSDGTLVAYKALCGNEVKRCGIAQGAGRRQSIFVESLALETGEARDLLGIVGGRLAFGRRANEEQTARMPWLHARPTRTEADDGSNPRRILKPGGTLDIATL